MGSPALLTVNSLCGFRGIRYTTSTSRCHYHARTCGVDPLVHDACHCANAVLGSIDPFCVSFQDLRGLLTTTTLSTTNCLLVFLTRGLCAYGSLQRLQAVLERAAGLTPLAWHSCATPQPLPTNLMTSCIGVVGLLGTDEEPVCSNVLQSVLPAS